jgi:hypothetical protein
MGAKTWPERGCSFPGFVYIRLSHRQYPITTSSSPTSTQDHSNMAATMSYEPTLSMSLSRTHLADAPSMADQLPSVNFNFEDLRDRMARFTSRFDDFIEKGRKRVLEERNQFRMSVAELQGMAVQVVRNTSTSNEQQQRIKNKRRAPLRLRR